MFSNKGQNELHEIINAVPRVVEKMCQDTGENRKSVAKLVAFKLYLAADSVLRQAETRDGEPRPPPVEDKRTKLKRTRRNGREEIIIQQKVCAGTYWRSEALYVIHKEKITRKLKTWLECNTCDNDITAQSAHGPMADGHTIDNARLCTRCYQRYRRDVRLEIAPANDHILKKGRPPKKVKQDN